MLQKLQWKRCVHATYANVKACLHVLVIHVHQYIIYTYMQRLHKRYSTLNYVTIHTAQHCITLQLQLPHTRIPHSWRPDIHAEQNNTTEHQTFTEHDQDIDDTLQCIIITQRPKKKKNHTSSHHRHHCMPTMPTTPTSDPQSLGFPKMQVSSTFLWHMHVTMHIMHVTEKKLYTVSNLLNLISSN